MAGKEEEVQDTSDYKLDKHSRKVKAHRLYFNKGEDDGKKGVSEQMKKSFNTFVEQHTPELSEEQLKELEQELNEVLGKNAKAGDWIHDFVHSDNPKFAGKSKEKRKQMALAAFYAKKRNEEVEIEEALKGNQHKLDKNKNGKLDSQDFKMLRKEEVEALVEDHVELIEAYHPDDYESTSEKSQFGGHRAVMKHKETGKHSYIGGASYKSAEHAKGEAETYRKHYTSGSGKMVPGANMRHDRAVSEYRKKAKEAGHMHENWDAMLAHVKKTGEATKTSTATKHDVKRTSTGTVYTKQRDADGNSKEFKRDPDQAKRGRGRPKKNAFSEAAEFLMSLDEETFDSLMEEGFDSFVEHFEQLDEVSKSTLVSYVKKATNGMSGVAINAHQAGGAAPGSQERKSFLKKANKRIDGIAKAADRLGK